MSAERWCPGHAHATETIKLTRGTSDSRVGGEFRRSLQQCVGSDGDEKAEGTRNGKSLILLPRNYLGKKLLLLYKIKFRKQIHKKWLSRGAGERSLSRRRNFYENKIVLIPFFLLIHYKLVQKLKLSLIGMTGSNMFHSGLQLHHNSLPLLWNWEQKQSVRSRWS